MSRPGTGSASLAKANAALARKRAAAKRAADRAERRRVEQERRDVRRAKREGRQLLGLLVAEGLLDARAIRKTGRDRHGRVWS